MLSVANVSHQIFCTACIYLYVCTDVSRCACTCALTQGLLPIFLYVVYLNSEGAACFVTSLMQVCVSSILHLSVQQRGCCEGRKGEGERGRKRGMACRDGAGEGGRLGSGVAEKKKKRQEGGAVVHGRSSRGGGPTRRAGGGREGGRSSERSSGLEKAGVSGCRGYKHTGRDTEKTGRGQVRSVVSQVSAAH